MFDKHATTIILCNYEVRKNNSISVSPLRRGFHDACGMAHGLELLGERWALFVVRELMLGPRRFGDLRADLPGISANILTQRLTELEVRGIVERTKLPPPANVPVYGLTRWGYEAEPIIQTLGRWAARSPGHDPMLPISAVSIMLSLRTMIDMARIGDLSLTIGFRFAETDYAGRLAEDGLVIERRPADSPDLMFTGTPEAFGAFIYGKVPPEALGGALSVTGDPELARRFADLFHLPPKVHSARQDTPAPA